MQKNKMMLKLMKYYSWHMDELLKLYNAISDSKEDDISKLILDIDEKYIRFGIEGVHIYFTNL